MKTKKKYTVILSVLGILQIVFALGIPLLSKYLLEAAQEVSSNNDKLDKIYLLAGIMLGCLLLTIIVKVFSNMLYGSFSVKRERELKAELYDTFINKEITELKSFHSGEIEQLFHSDIVNVVRVELDTWPTIVRQVARLVLSAALLLYIDWKFLIFLLVCGILGFGFAKIYSKIIKPHHKRVLETDGEANSFLVESANQLKLIQAYGANPYASEYYNKLNDLAANEKRKRNVIMYGANSGIFGFSNIIYVLALCYGAIFIAKGDLTYGSLLAMVQLLNNIQSPLLSMSSLLSRLTLGKTSKTRIDDIYKLDNIKPSMVIDSFDSIEFNNVSFTYDNERYILKDFNLVINKGDTILFSGPSGIGKTTLFMLLLGFIKPTNGTINIKYNDKVIPISSSTRSLFSYVPQENIIFSGSIKDNLYILTGKNEEEIIEALKKANVYDEVMNLPDGINTKLGERGNGLSLGQIQRILIAASILKNNQILLLDEFSSALDEANEDSIINNIKNMNKTIIYITHRTKRLENQRVVTLNEIK